MKFFIGIVFVLLLFVFDACNEVDTTQIQQKYDYAYFPLDSGSWREYSVQQITIDSASGVYDTSNYFLREIVAGTFIDGANDSLQILKRYYRDSLAKNWQNYQTWYAGINTNYAIQVEENIRYVKQRFPLALGLQWNGNLYNNTDTLAKYSCEVKAINMPETIEDYSFEKVLTISQREFLSNVRKYSFYEKYAYNLGLIEKVAINIYSGDVDLSIPIEHRVTQGTIYVQKLIDYGSAN